MGDAENRNPEGGGWGDNESAAAAPAPASPEVTHTVQSGETLSRIAKEYYGDESQYRRIYDANRDTLDDPDNISAGQKLKIPPAE
jgi:nucleoid-associated protein YgaU